MEWKAWVMTIKWWWEPKLCVVKVVIDEIKWVCGLSNDEGCQGYG